MEPIWEYTIKLIRFVLNGDIPELPEDIDFEKLFAFGKSHGVENMLYVGLRDLHIDVPEETMQKFKTAYEMQIMVEATQALELEAISEAFEEAGIDHVPLKGSVIKYLYPTPDYRKSGDIDILIRKKDENKVKVLMKSIGYTLEKEDDNHEVHVAYIKPPFIEVEVHRRLTEKISRASKLCEKPWKYAYKESNHCYKFSNEFFYVHLLSHLCKHLYLGGAGIKLICDFYIILLKAKIDTQSLNELLKKSKLANLNKMVIGLVDKWFENGEKISKDIYVLEEIVLTSGSFGTKENRAAMVSSGSKMNDILWMLKRIFPPITVLQYRYPVVLKRRYLLPIIWIDRIIDLLFLDREFTKKKINTKFNGKSRNKDLVNLVEAIRPK